MMVDFYTKDFAKQMCSADCRIIWNAGNSVKIIKTQQNKMYSKKEHMKSIKWVEEERDGIEKEPKQTAI